ncbi:hypothetical protein Hanom_Chr12g01066681 [Helianthus anomalus]
MQGVLERERGKSKKRKRLRTWGLCVGEKEPAATRVQVRWSHDDDGSDADQARRWSTSTSLPLGGL